ncbi:uncharacterized protein LOC109839678 [Asparagus officinalis]|nr:uncharacterized protein LOC109839678 [Asparagus officinalis]
MLRAESEESIEAAILALLNLAVKDESNKIKIIDAGALDPLISFLQSRNSNLQVYAMPAFLNSSPLPHTSPTLAGRPPSSPTFNTNPLSPRSASRDSVESNSSVPDPADWDPDYRLAILLNSSYYCIYMEVMGKSFFFFLFQRFVKDRDVEGTGGVHLTYLLISNLNPWIMESSSSNRRALLCHCGRRAVLSRSGTKRNPGRLFLGCANWRESNCGFFKWVSDEEEFEGSKAELVQTNQSSVTPQVSRTVSSGEVWERRKLSLDIMDLLKLVVFAFLFVLHVGTPQAKSDAITTLSNLSTTGNTLSTILSCFPIPSLVDILNTFKKSSKTVEKCVALLESLMPFEHARVSLTSEPGGVLSVVEALEDGSSRTKEHAVGALLTLCKSDCCRYREVILNEGAIPGLLELTVQGTDKARPKARELLQILRGSKDRRSEMEGETLEDIVNDIVCGIEGEDRSGKAKRMLAEMVKVSMEQSLRHLERRASVVCTTPTAELATLK